MPTGPTCTASRTIDTSTGVGHLLTLMALQGHIIVTQSPGLTLGLTLGAV